MLVSRLNVLLRVICNWSLFEGYAAWAMPLFSLVRSADSITLTRASTSGPMALLLSFRPCLGVSKTPGH
jgi:hypothetical protein